MTPGFEDEVVLGAAYRRIFPPPFRPISLALLDEALVMHHPDFPTLFRYLIDHFGVVVTKAGVLATVDRSRRSAVLGLLLLRLPLLHVGENDRFLVLNRGGTLPANLSPLSPSNK